MIDRDPGIKKRVDYFSCIEGKEGMKDIWYISFGNCFSSIKSLFFGSTPKPKTKDVVIPNTLVIEIILFNALLLASKYLIELIKYKPKGYLDFKKKRYCETTDSWTIKMVQLRYQNT